MSTPIAMHREHHVTVFFPRTDTADRTSGAVVSRAVSTATHPTVIRDPPPVPAEVKAAVRNSPALQLLRHELRKKSSRRRLPRTRGTLGVLTPNEIAHARTLLDHDRAHTLHLHTKQLSQDFKVLWQNLPRAHYLFVPDEEG